MAAAAMLALGAGTAFADDDGYVADPRQYAQSDEARCQAVGDERAGENDNNGLQQAEDAVMSVIENEDDEEECDNSGGKRR